MCMTMCAQTPEGRGETRGAGAVPRCAWSLVLASVESRVVAAKATLLCCFNCTVLSWLVVLEKLVSLPPVCRTWREGMRGVRACVRGPRVGRGGGD